MQIISNKYLEIVRDRGKKDLPLERVYSNICDVNLFLIAYHSLAKRKGALTKGLDIETIDEMSLKKINKIIEMLKNGEYKPKPSRRVNIPKANGKTRSLGIPCWTDKLIQRAVMMVLEAYYEPIFSTHSHGFRPNKGCHTALEEIAINWRGTRWFIEGDIKDCFDAINYDKLLYLINKRIKDQRLIKLIRMWLKAGYIDDWKYQDTYSGTPQGGVISPLLANIYLHELDMKLEELSDSWNKGKSRGANPEYNKWQKYIRKAKTGSDIAEVRRLQKEFKQMKLKGLTWSDPQDPDYRRFKFVRYADDFIVGFVGSKAEARILKDEIAIFLRTELNLTLSTEKTKITNATKDKARFLNYEIYAQTSLNRPKINGNIRLDMPHDVYHKWNAKYAKFGKPYHRPYYLELSDYMIISAYNSEFQGLYNYYIMAQNVSKWMYKLKFTAMNSAAKTLAAKHKTSVKKIYRKYATISDNRRILKIEVSRKDKPPLVATFSDFPLKWVKFPVRSKVKNLNNDKAHGIKVLSDKNSVRSDLLTRLMNNTCEICGSDTNIEVHHIRKMSDINKNKEGWQKLMSSMRRKTLITCRECHQKIHKGKYDGIAL